MKLGAEKIKKLKNYFAERDDVALAFLFGSYAEGGATGRSDVDVAVYYHLENWSADEEFLKEEEIRSAVIDIVGLETDLVVLNRAPAPLVFEILRNGEPLAIKNPGLYSDLLMRQSSEAIDFMQDAKDYGEIFFRSASLSPRDQLRLTQRLTFLVKELSDLPQFKLLTQAEYSDEEKKENRNKRRAIERWVESIVNCSIDVAKILLASNKLRLPDTYEDMLLGLHWQLKLDEKIARKLAGFVSLRNIMAHQYLDIRFSQIRKFVDEAAPFYQELISFARRFLDKKEN